jgi:hypothetical protein
VGEAAGHLPSADLVIFDGGHERIPADGQIAARWRT